MGKKGAARKITWYCRELKDGSKKGCGAGIYHSTQNIGGGAKEIMKRKLKYCPTERKRTWHVFKETKS